jgi:hypothetical protein
MVSGPRISIHQTGIPLSHTRLFVKALVFFQANRYLFNMTEAHTNIFRTKMSWRLGYTVVGILMIALGCWAISLFIAGIAGYDRLAAGIVIVVFVAYIVIDRNILRVIITDEYVERKSIRTTRIDYEDATELVLVNSKAYFKSEKSRIILGDEYQDMDRMIDTLTRKAVLGHKIPISGDDFMLDKYYKPLKKESKT